MADQTPANPVTAAATAAKAAVSADVTAAEADTSSALAKVKAFALANYKPFAAGAIVALIARALI